MNRKKHAPQPPTDTTSDGQARFIRRLRRHRITVRTARILILILFLLLWEFCADQGIIDSFIFSSPSRIALCFYEMTVDRSIFLHIGITLYETIVSFLLVTAIGILAAVLLWYSRSLSEIREREMAAFRRDNLGFVFQEFNLLDTFSVQDNILLPLVLSGRPFREMEEKLKPLAAQLGIADILKKYPYEISGGQKQRTAVARALITSPQIVLADEPTGALDSKATDSLLRLFAQINAAGQTILMVTHSAKAASHAGRVLFIRDGQVFHQLYRGESTDSQLYQKIADTLTLLATGGETDA